ncbi:MAG: LptA/OstA family protein [Pseudomonadota bacterium]
MIAFGIFSCVTSAVAQGTSVAFGSVKADPTLPVEVVSDTLDVNQENGSAEFKGDVQVDQGEMRLTAKRVLVIYSQNNSAIERMEATGDVVLISGPDAAESDFAEYTIKTGVIVMTGDVLLTQGQNALTSDKMTVNLVTGTANMAGRVKTILVPEGSDN